MEGISMKKMKILTSILIVVFLLSIIPAQGMFAAVINSNEINWYIVDHTNWSNDPAASDYIINSQVSATAQKLITYWNEPERNPDGLLNDDGLGLILDRHIQISTDGTQLTFTGYGEPAFHDFLFSPNSISEEKIFKFSVDEKAATYHSLQAYGFVFNASYDLSDLNNRKMSGYYIGITQTKINLYLMNTVDVSLLNKSGAGFALPTTLSDNAGGFTLVQSVAKSNFAVTPIGDPVTSLMRYFTIVATPTSVVVSQFTDSKFSTLVNSMPIINQTGLTDIGAYGFGPYVAYNSHGCSDVTRVVITDLTFSSPTLVSINAPATARKVELETQKVEPVQAWQLDDVMSLIAIPEQWMDDTSRVVVRIAPTPLPLGSSPNLVTAAGELKSVDQTLVQAFQVDLYKQIIKTSGTTEVKIDPADIKGNLTVRIPLDATLAKYANIKVVVITADGKTADIPTTRVTVDGKEYLQFANNQFNANYGLVVFGAQMPAIPKTGEHDAWPLGIGMILAGAALWLFLRKIRLNAAA
jgi:LPXTG-motif cell wall-anchored protein